ncbi:MAG TPA: secretion protein F, partial [Ruminococcaceae bacterium]|nr:secretion protein F [Oscillospiraceae bacterium]
MTGLLFLFAALLAAGLFFLLSDLLKLPTLAAANALLSAGKPRKKAAKSVEAYLMRCAGKLARLIRMDEYKRSRLENTLEAAGIPMTPELYTAYAIVKGGAIAVLAILCLFLLPLLAPVLMLLAALVYFKEVRKADEQL